VITRVVFRRLADLVVAIHALACLFFLVGGLLAFWQPWLALVHVPVALWVCTSYLCGWTCPLTPVEKRLRRAAGDPVYQGGFVDHYTRMLFCGRTFQLKQPSEETSATAKTAAVRKREMAMGAVFSVWTLAVYAGNYDRLAETLWQARNPVEPVAAERNVASAVQTGSPAAFDGSPTVSQRCGGLDECGDRPVPDHRQESERVSRGIQRGLRYEPLGFRMMAMIRLPSTRAAENFAKVASSA
jgi:hypothetical protein